MLLLTAGGREVEVVVGRHHELERRHAGLAPVHEPGQLQVGGGVIGLRVAGLVLGEAEGRNPRRDLERLRRGALEDRTARVSVGPAAQRVEGDERAHPRVALTLYERGHDRAEGMAGERHPGRVRLGRVRVRRGADEGERRVHCVDRVRECLGRARTLGRGPDDRDVAVPGEVLGGPPVRALVAAEAVLDQDDRARGRIGQGVGGAQDRAVVSGDPGGLAERRNRDSLGGRVAHPVVVRLRGARIGGRGARRRAEQSPDEHGRRQDRPPTLACQ